MSVDERIQLMRAALQHDRPILSPAKTESGDTSGSCTKLWPFLLLGGIVPVVACLRHSMIVVLPAPLCPTMRESGVLKSNTSSWCGPKLRMPCTFSFSTVHISKSQLHRRASRTVHGTAHKTRVCYGRTTALHSS
jgi:hypothetical protein